MPSASSSQCLIGAVAVGLLIFLHIGVSPLDTVEYPTTPLIFVFNVIFFSTALFLIIFYAVRQFTFAEERVEREHQRSENLLLNIFPPSVASRLKDSRMSRSPTPIRTHRYCLPIWPASPPARAK